MSNLLITGGKLRENGFELGEGKYYGCAKLLRLDTDSGEINELLSIDKGNDNYPDIHPNLEFTVGDVAGNELWLSTDTEIRHYSYPNLDLLSTYSHPCFHNIHSVAVHDERLYVTSTGLDMVVVLNKYSGDIISYQNAEGKPTWHRFLSDFDYRKIHSTRPHDCHPNYVFWISNEPWVTRCTQEDAVQLSDTSNRIDISGPDKEISVHDGIVKGEYVYFTSVDGCIVVADINTKEVIETINIYDLKGYGGLRGWCRGLYMTDDIVYIGFSRLRKTRRIEKIKWVSHLINKGKSIDNCSVLAIDLLKREIIADYHIPENMIDAVYTILPEPAKP